LKANEWLQRFYTPINLNKIEFLPLITLLKDAKTVIEQQQTVIDKQQPVIDAAELVVTVYNTPADQFKDYGDFLEKVTDQVKGLADALEDKP
jgi:hypothetical protein